MDIPDRLGKYRITEVLGAGAMGVVYKGFDPDIRRVVALKTIRRVSEDDPDAADSMAARFRNEAQAAGRLQHPGIVAVYEYGEAGSTAFIAMEYVEGNSLSHYLKQGVSFTDDDILSVVCQLLDALEHAHAQGVWHRDIKPANLIMTLAGRLKIADFGIARIEDAGLTRTVSVIGTPSSMSPEQFLGHPIDRRVDLYSAGVLLYQLLTGQPPFSGSAEALMYKVVHEPAPLPSQHEAGRRRPRGYDAIVARAMAKSPDQRYASAGAFKAALLSAIGSQVHDSVSQETVVRLPPRRPPAGFEPTLAAGGSSRPADAGSGSSSQSRAPGHWDASVLSQVEATLARHVGPMAGVMVRRTARDCDDLALLVSRLAEQVTSPTVRSAFLADASRSGAGSGTTGGTAGGSRSAGASAVSPAGGAAVHDALREGAERLLAQHVGPIARILVKKAAVAAPQREAFGARLAEAIGEGEARRRFLADFERLP